MAIELKQGSKEPTVSAAFDDDRSGGSILHMAANAKVKTTLIGVITATSPGIITGLGADTNLTIPGGATPSDIRYYAVNPGSTGGTITVGIDTTSNYFLNGQSVATLALSGQQLPAGAAVQNLFTPLAQTPLGFAHTVTGYFAQTATSTAAGPFYVEIDYYR